jgi:predicted AAA+ superfamily ATPase
MQELFESQNRVLQNVSLDFKRSLYHSLPWSERAIMLMGARGTGKSTLFQQYLKENFQTGEALYITLDDIYFKQHTLVETARKFLQNGGKLLVIDEVHKYPDWSREIKNIYDLMPTLKILFTGSSILEMQKSFADLSRRVLNYYLPELSFREFLGIKYQKNISQFTLNQIFENHLEISRALGAEIGTPIMYFKEYLKSGAYPFFKETNLVDIRLKQTVNLIVDTDMPSAMPVEYATLNQIKKLLYIIAQSVPFKPNITKLAEQVGTTRPKLYEMLKMLEAARLIYGLHHSNVNIGSLSKPEKIFLHNTNLLFVFSENSPEVGTVRETFFINQLESAGHKVNYTEKGDFLIDEKWLIEVGGRNKTQKQIAGQKNAFLALDDIETGYGNTIPVWLFGFLY